jgi:hypothetical protein
MVEGAVNMRSRFDQITLRLSSSSLRSAILQPKSLLLSLPLCLAWLQPVAALPPSEDVPEEILRTEIITEARSPLNGEPLTAAEYAELEAKLRTGPPIEPEVSPRVRRVVNLLRLRRFIKTFFPFIPIKSLPAKSQK